jgi:hypothetical protein
MLTSTKITIKIIRKECKKKLVMINIIMKITVDHRHNNIYNNFSDKNDNYEKL